MADEKLAKLVNRLHSNTVNGKIQWEKTIKEGVFLTSFPDYSIEISARPSEQYPDASDYLLQIFDKENSLIEEVVDTDLAQNLGGEMESYRVMRDIYTIARRSAHGVEKAIDAILEALEDDIPF